VRARNYLLAYMAILAAGLMCAFFLLPSPTINADPVQANDLAMRLGDQFGSLSKPGFQAPKSDHDYVVIDSQGNVLYATKAGLSEDVFTALRRGDSIVDITLDGEVLGKVIIANDINAQLQAYRNSLLIALTAILAATSAVMAVFAFSLDRQVLRPFHNMQGFAVRLAAGELDEPLNMDKGNAFGAFTESFDLLRDELQRARLSEQAAEQSKRELVASLSHDIQTPLSSIKAVAELMELTADQGSVQKLKTIQEKASQIESLVTELFQTTLAELDSLSVQVAAVPSSQIEEIAKSADYQGLLHIEDIPACLVLADPSRLAQVLDNIIANSYKYAGTQIVLAAEVDDDCLRVSLRDFGPGVPDEELPLLRLKYYRGSSATGQNGYGLGLFIASYLVERMGGRLECMNAKPGFEVCFWLRLDG